jgi:hypothetical protein
MQPGCQSGLIGMLLSIVNHVLTGIDSVESVCAYFKIIQRTIRLT